MPETTKTHSAVRTIHTLAAIWAAAVGAALGLGPLACGAEALSAWEVAETSLIRKLDSGVALSQLITGGTVTRDCRWLPEQRVLRIESAVRGEAKTAPVVELAFRLRERQEEAGYSRLIYRDEIWYGSTFWTGPDWTRVGKNWHHPGENTPSVRCWRAPRDGRITVSGHVRKAHLAGDGVRASIFHGGREVWKAEIEGLDERGVDPQLSLDVRQGDAIRFVVHKRGGIACDTTYWDPILAYAGGETFQASQAFGDQQGRAGWFYEMVGSAAAARPVTPVIHTLGLDLSLREAPAASQADALPFFVVADGDRSGVVLQFEAAGAWQFQATETADGLLRIALLANVGTDGKLPGATLHAYDGPWTAGLARLKPDLTPQVQPLYEQLIAPLTKKPDFEMLLTVQAEWRRDDQLKETAESYAAAVADHLDRAGQLLSESGSDQHAPALAKLRETAARPGLPLADWRNLYLQTRLLKRDIALSQPLLNFDQLLFCKRVPPSYSHLVGQYFGWRQRPGGGLFVLEHPGCSLAVRDLVGGQLPAGNFLEPRLSYDGQRIACSFVACPPQPPNSTALPVNEQGDESGYFHIYEMGADGSGLRQLTDGCYDDMMPCYLPDGGLAFVSTRRRSYSRCFGPNFSNRWHSYTLHRMNADGSQLRILSMNDVSEWFPTVANSGEILFARWDYIDRDAVTHQNLWSIRPDGTNPIAVWGNATPKPHCTFQAKPIPGSRKFAFIASAHHALTAGPVCLLDPAVDPNSLEAITRITPGPFPEAESSQIPEYYESPWPLSEKLFLVAYSRDRLIFEGDHLRTPNPDNALGLYLLDAAGNRELLYRDPQISSTTPIPLRPQPLPHALPTTLPPAAPPTGELLITDVYQGLGHLPRGTIKQLRVIQIFPKTTWLANSPQIGIAGEENSRAILGTVPVEADGSARFVVPAHKPILFQALDQDGCAYQTMRSTTSVQPGERTACVGCHEHRMSAPPQTAGVPLALRRPPSPLDPGELGGRPFSFIEAVQPILDRHCVRCHGGEKTEKGVDLSAKPFNGFTQ
ncbi:MAG: hypothetical protein NTY19_35465 [Planctomycetota bacterium]|nr:hypothetical protein [Planctomycetota bacterium]